MLTLSIFLLLRLLSSVTNAALFDVVNRCSYAVWPATSSGGGVRLDPGQSWTIFVPPATGGKVARVWGRTDCNFDANGRGSCASGDCNGLLQCNDYGSAPCTLAEYSLDQFSNLDFIDISLVDGFNIPMDFSPTTGSCPRGIRCAGNSILNQCPGRLKSSGGCQHPCAVYKTNEYCCNTGSCGPTDLSRFFKQRCPNAYSYALDDQTSTFTCPNGTNYRVTFCP